MVVAIDKVRRLVVPKGILDQLGINPESELGIITDGFHFPLRKKEEKSILHKKGKFTFMSTDWVGESNLIKLIPKAHKEHT